ncbi:MAG: hypothetical protein ACRYFS_11870 [Janthinobacterium lividum]
MSKSVAIRGLNITVENPKGSMRSGMGPNGSWQTEMRHDYGDIAGAPQVGTDGDPVDVFVGDNPDAQAVYVVNQINPDGTFDEHKCMAGFSSQDEAQSAYLSNYEPGWTGMGTVAAMETGAFVKWLHTGDLTQPAPVMSGDGISGGEADPALTAPVADAGAFSFEDAILTRMDDAAGSGPIRLLASPARIRNENTRYFEPEFLRAAAAQGDAWCRATPRYGEEPHPPFDRSRGQYLTDSSNEVWRQDGWTTDAAGNLISLNTPDPRTPKGRRVSQKLGDKEKIGGSVRWCSTKAAPIRKLADGASIQYFGPEMIGHCFPMVFDHVPNPAFPQAGGVVDADQMIPMTDATLPLVTVELADASLAAFNDSTGAPRNTNSISASPKEKRPLKTATELRAQAATIDDPDTKQSLLDAADSLEAAAAAPTLDAIVAAVTEKLSPDLSRASQFVADSEKKDADAAERAKVVALADSVEQGTAPEVARFTDTDTRKEMADAVRMCPTEDAGRTALEREIALTDRVSSRVRLEMRGLPAPGGILDGTNTRTQVMVDAGDKQIAEVRQSLHDAFDQYALNSGNPVDKQLRETNKQFVAKMQRQSKKDPNLIAASAALMLETNDAKKEEIAQTLIQAARRNIDMTDSGGMTDASVTTAAVLNQGLLGDFMLERAYQDLEALPLCEGIGAEGMQGAPGSQANIGTVLRVMTEYQVPAPHDYQGLDFDSLSVTEGQGIPQTSLMNQYQEFAVRPRSLGFSVTKILEMAMLHGPLNYDVTARTLYHTLYEFQRDTNSSLYLDMVTTADELGAVAVAGEVPAGADYTVGNVQDGKVYNAATVAFIVQPACGGNVTGAVRYAGIATPSANNAYRTPLVVPRPMRSVSSFGAITDTIANAITVNKTSGGARLLNRGYLDPNGNIANKTDVASGNTITADYAVDFATGKFLFTTASGVTAANLQLSYSYTTNCDFFQVNFGANAYPNSAKQADYFNGIFYTNDQLVGRMSQYPVFAPPNICLSTRLGSTAIRNAAIFYRFNSPNGTNLGVTSANLYAERDGVNYMQMNAPSILGDDTLLFLQKGVTKFGVDYPAHMEGPFPAYDTATGRMKDEKNYYMSEGSVRCTPLARDINGKAFNAKLRKKILY